MTLTIDYDRQEEFLNEMIEQLQYMKSYARNEKLFESVDDIIIEVKEKMNDLELCMRAHD